MGQETSRWETELWSYLDRGDGRQCPVYQSCQLRRQGVQCLSDHAEYCAALRELIDDEDLDLANPPPIEYESSRCLDSGRPFKLVEMLAKRYWKKSEIGRLPVSTDLITQGGDNLTIEVRRVPLKANHGAVWRLSDCWLVHLNSNDTPAKQRFTLYHEIFHILAHYKATPVFKKTSASQEGSFNELLADHFATTILLPQKWVKAKWAEVQDISQMAAVFDVPKPIMWCSLKRQRLI